MILNLDMGIQLRTSFLTLKLHTSIIHDTRPRGSIFIFQGSHDDWKFFGVQQAAGDRWRLQQLLLSRSVNAEKWG